MLDQQLPNLINPSRLAEKNAILKGTLLLSTMSRLKEFLADPKGEVVVSMKFSRDEDQNIFIDLQVNTELILTCQRCMNSLNYPISINVLLSPMMDETKISRLQNYEPLIMQGELVAVQDIVEDEILLNLPLIAKHSQNSCSVVLSASQENTTENPFKTALSKLKK
jgi:uncharacterized protein